MSQKQLFYFADPMCSWCWGFSAVIGEIKERYGCSVPIHPVMGGLRAGTATPMSAEDKAYVREHWEHVRARTGQEFDFSFFDREGFVYDTEPACRAVVAARRVAPARALDMLAALHRAFYAEGRDTTQVDALCEIASEQGLDERAFRDDYMSEAAIKETRGDFYVTRKARVQGFPTLVGGTEEGALTLLTHGYAPLEDLEPAIARWMLDE